jgi:hypothetical protein
MRRVIAFHGDERGWFDLDVAKRFVGRQSCDDSANYRCVHTGGPTTSQDLYRTAGGRWVRCTSGPGFDDHYEFIDDRAAAMWLILNEDESALEGYLPETASESGPPITGR